MRTITAPPDDTARRTLGNAIAQIGAEIGHAEAALPEILREQEFLLEDGSAERLAANRFQIARRGLAIEDLLPRIQGLLKEIKRIAGEKAMLAAAAPIVFEK